MAKGIGGSGLPIGAMMYHEQYDTWGPGGHVGTFRGNVPAFVGGTRAIEYIESHNLLDHATEVGTYIRSRFRELAEEVPEIVDIRGKGQFTGVEFQVDGTPLKIARRVDPTRVLPQGRSRVVRRTPQERPSSAPTARVDATPSGGRNEYHHRIDP